MDQVSVYHGTATPTLSVENAQHSRRLLLANFIKSRRAALSPSDVGLPATGRRRVKGLRREEVAEVAGISTAWYTWIEQARDVNISEETLQSLSRTFRLSDSERVQLFQLAGHGIALVTDALTAQVVETARQVVDSMAGNPAFVLDRKWNLVCWNDAAEELFCFSQFPQSLRNLVLLTFTVNEYKSLFVNWHEVAQCTLAHFRSDSVSLMDDADVLSLIRKLQTESEVFRELWNSHNADWPYRWRKEIIHPERGRLFYNTLDLELSRPARLRIMTYSAVNAF